MKIQSRPLFGFQQQRNLRHLSRIPADKRWLQPSVPPSVPLQNTGRATAGTLLLSIIVPTYNYGHTLQRCISSVLDQWQDDIEIIVVDDGSTDDTVEVCGALSPSGKTNFHYVRQDNRGAASARNHGLELSQGEYALLLDADDALLPGTVSAVCGVLRSRPDVDLLIGGQVTVRVDGRERSSGPDPMPESPCRRLEDYLVWRRISMGHGSFVARRALLMQRKYPESLPKREDIPVFAYLLAHARIAHIERPLVRIFKHADSLRHQKFAGDEDPLNLVNEVFRALPEDCQRIRSAYAALRYQSAVRDALKSRRWQDARRYWLASLRADIRQTLRPAQLRKNLRTALWRH